MIETMAIQNILYEFGDGKDIYIKEPNSNHVFNINNIEISDDEIIFVIGEHIK